MASASPLEKGVFNYVYSCDLDINVRLKIGNLEGTRKREQYQALLDEPILQFSGLYEESGCSEMYVTCQAYADGSPLGLPTMTSYKPFSTRWNWNEWITLHVKYSDLPRNAQVALTVWDIKSPHKAMIVGGTTVTLFGKNGTLRTGIHDLKLWPGHEGDGGMATTTPGKASTPTTPSAVPTPAPADPAPAPPDQMAQLSKLTKKHRKGHMTKVDWLDRLTFREIEVINEREKRDSDFMFLMVELPRFLYSDTEYTVVHYEKDANEVIHIRSSAEIVVVPDPEMLMENLVESKHHKLARSLRTGVSDKDLKPNAAVRDVLNVIVKYPPNKALSSEEQDLVWRFRFYLSNQKEALTKFLKCVNWKQTYETKQALDLLAKWQPIDVVDALELLSPQFTNRTVRRYAVARLQQADDEELLMYFLQLVQALKYEDFDEIVAQLEESTKKVPTMTLNMQVKMGEEGKVEGGNPNTDPLNVSEMLHEKSQSMESSTGSLVSDTSQLSMKESYQKVECDLATFLIRRACHNNILANYLYWFLMVECDDQDVVNDPKISQMYINVMKRYSKELLKAGKEGAQMRKQLTREQKFVERILQLVKCVARESGNRKKKVERMQNLLNDPVTFAWDFVNFEPLSLPLDPVHKIVGIIPEKAALFKSALMPCRLVFRTTTSEEYQTIFKHGDDLRQDQLILQIIQLMDKLLRQENLDLKLTPYKVLATSCKHGFVQFIESTAVADVLSTEGSIQSFFRKHAPSENAMYGISADVMDTYIKSCAGYCVITYLLGIGDRHLDNLLLTKKGNLFHVDFGYILGRDPKPLPPPMKLSKEMVEGMGGASSEHYQDFKKLCYTAFLHLRRHANLILNLFSLMVDANVPDIALEPDKTVKKVQDKFRLDLSDEEAVHFMQTLIDISVGAVFAAVVEQIHKFAQYWRK